MTYYIQVNPLNGRREFYELVSNLNERGYDNVEYHPISVLPNRDMILSHLRFNREEDATAYSLTYGGDIVKGVPVLHRHIIDAETRE